MSQPYTPPPATVSYHVQIGSGEWAEYLEPVRPSKFVADNIYAGFEAHVVFRNDMDLNLVRSNFNDRINGLLRQLRHTEGFFCAPPREGATYRLYE